MGQISVATALRWVNRAVDAKKSRRVRQQRRKESQPALMAAIAQHIASPALISLHDLAQEDVIGRSRPHWTRGK